MKINVSDIKPQGSDFNGQLSLEELGAIEGLEFVEPIKIFAKVERIDKEIIAKMGVSGKYSSVCSRCLESVEQEWKKDFWLGIEIEAKAVEIDLGEEVRQEVVLNFPANILCDKECRGLCPNCGKNLNNETCKCRSTT